MIRPDKERVAYEVRSGLDGPTSVFHKNAFKLKEMLELVMDNELKQTYIDYHGLHQYLNMCTFRSDYPVGLRTEIRISKSGVPRMFYQTVTNNRSIEIAGKINDIERDTQAIFPVVI